jgi:misacylated tRNA(Ala) deacylase
VVVTQKLYLADPYRAEFAAEVTAVDGGWLALAATAFFPGGGGQPADTGTLSLPGRDCLVTGVRADETGRIWHECLLDAVVGTTVQGRLDWPRRYAFMRYHTLLHIANAVVLAEYRGLITGVQIGVERARIDFDLGGFEREQVPLLEAKINEVVVRALPVDAEIIDEEEFHTRPELVRTATVAPPVVDGRVRVVRIEGFDSQACGGTHVRNTSEVGPCSIQRFDNKGKSNKRFYLVLNPSG